MTLPQSGLARAIEDHLHNFAYDDALFLAENLYSETPSEQHLVLLSKCCLMQGNLDRAAFFISKQVLSTPDGKYLKGQIYFKLFKFTIAEVALTSRPGGYSGVLSFEEMISFYGHVASHVFNLLGKICYELNDSAKAQRYFENSLSCNVLQFSSYTSLCKLGAFSKTVKRKNEDPIEVKYADIFYGPNSHGDDILVHIKDGKVFCKINATGASSSVDAEEESKPVLSSNVSASSVESEVPSVDDSDKKSSDSEKEPENPVPVASPPKKPIRRQRQVLGQTQDNSGDTRTMPPPASRPTVTQRRPGRLPSTGDENVCTPVNSRSRVQTRSQRVNMEKKGSKMAKYSLNKDVSGRAVARSVDSAIGAKSRASTVSTTNTIRAAAESTKNETVDSGFIIPVSQDVTTVDTICSGKVVVENQVLESGIHKCRSLIHSIARAFADYHGFICSKTVERLRKDVPRHHFVSSIIQSLVARCEYENNQYDVCVETFRKLRRNDPFLLDDMTMYASALWHLHDMNGLLTEAHELRSSTSRPNAAAMVMIGNWMSMVQDHKQAVRSLECAVQLEPRSSTNYLQLGHAYVADSNPDDARAAYNNALQLDRRNYAALFKLGVIHYKSEEYTTALVNFERALHINRDHPVLLLYMAKCLHVLSHTQRALTYCKMAIAKSPENAAARYYAADMLYSAGNYDAALSQIAVLKRLAPKEPGVYILAGKIYTAKNDIIQKQLHNSWAMALNRSVGIAIGEHMRLNGSAVDASKPTLSTDMPEDAAPSMSPHETGRWADAYEYEVPDGS